MLKSFSFQSLWPLFGGIYRLVYFLVVSCEFEMGWFAGARCYCNKSHRKQRDLVGDKGKGEEAQNLQAYVKKS